MNIEAARNKLRLDGTDNDTIIQPLLDAMPSYIEQKTGVTSTRQQNDDTVKDIVTALEGFLLQIWYNPEQRDVDKLETITQSLIKTLGFMKE